MLDYNNDPSLTINQKKYIIELFEYEKNLEKYEKAMTEYHQAFSEYQSNSLSQSGGSYNVTHEDLDLIQPEKPILSFPRSLPENEMASLIAHYEKIINKYDEDLFLFKESTGLEPHLPTIPKYIIDLVKKQQNRKTEEIILKQNLNAENTKNANENDNNLNEEIRNIAIITIDDKNEYNELKTSSVKVLTRQ